MRTSLLFLLLVTIGCSKDSTHFNTYYFNCEVDGKNIQLSYLPDANGVSPNGVYMTGKVKGNTSVLCSSTQCPDTGICCTGQGLMITEDVPGTYEPYLFNLNTLEGGDSYRYAYSAYGLDTTASMTVTITKIDFVPGDGNNTGFLEGNFSGTISKQKTSTGMIYPPVSISGSFSVPLNH